MYGGERVVVWMVGTTAPGDSVVVGGVFFDEFLRTSSGGLEGVHLHGLVVGCMNHLFECVVHIAQKGGASGKIACWCRGGVDVPYSGTGCGAGGLDITWWLSP